MAFTGLQGTANIEATRWLIENEPVILQPAGHWPTRGVKGRELVNSRVPQLAPASITVACDPVEDGSDEATQQAYTFNNYTAFLEFCNSDADMLRDPNHVEPMVVELLKIKLEYAWWERLDAATGETTNGGLPDFAAPSRILDVAGNALSFPCLEQAFSLVTANNGRPTMIMSSQRSLESYRNLCWAAGISPPSMPWRWYDPAKRRWVAGEVTTFRGVPWLVNGMMANNGEPENRRIYFMVVGDDGGTGPTRGLTRIVPADLVNNPYIKRVTNGVPDFSNQTVRTAKAIWLSMPAGVSLGSQGALSILQHFDHVGTCATGGE
jgi:hypothetical protein